MQPLTLEYVLHIPDSRQQLELVERQGVSHTDSMCDAMMEAISTEHRDVSRLHVMLLWSGSKAQSNRRHLQRWRPIPRPSGDVP
jgi:hypothetical protein